MAVLRNKFSHTFSLFFLCTYQNQWPSFFTDIFAFIRSAPAPSSPTRLATSPDPPNITLNTHICLLFFRVVLEISGEISDQLLKSARAFLPERHARDSKVKDLVRERDARGLSDAVIGIVTECVTTLNNFGTTYDKTESDSLQEVIEWGLKAFGSYIRTLNLIVPIVLMLYLTDWIDISLTCNPITIQLLFSLLSSANAPQSQSLFPASVSVRSTTVLALQRMVSKGLKEPRDKLELLRVLDLGKVLTVLEERTREQRVKGLQAGNEPDEDEEKYRENLGKLLSALGLELLDLTKDASTSFFALKVLRSRSLLLVSA
jgi:exportin-T